jgi:integrase/recombinase XerC
MKHLTHEQITNLIAAATSPRDRLLLTLCYEHGLRISEALALTPARVQRDFLCTRPLKDGRTTTQRLSASTAQLWASVTATLAPSALIFPFSRMWASVIFHRAAEAAGIQLAPRQGIHTLRHSCAHRLLDTGAGLTVVQRKLGHRSLASTGVYLEADDAAVDHASAKAFSLA